MVDAEPYGRFLGSTEGTSHEGFWGSEDVPYWNRSLDFSHEKCFPTKIFALPSAHDGGWSSVTREVVVAEGGPYGGMQLYKFSHSLQRICFLLSSVAQRG